MKKICVVGLALLVISGVFAQEEPKAGPPPEAQQSGPPQGAPRGPPPKDWSITIGGFGRGVFAPIQYHGEGKEWSVGYPKTLNDVDSEMYTGLGASWGFQYLSLGLTVNAGSELIGVNVDVKLDKTTLAAGDNGYAYVKPFGFLSMKVGKYNDATLGGKIGSTDFHRFTVEEKGEDNIFTRFLSSENTAGNVSYSTTFYGARDASSTSRAEGEIGQKGALLLLTPLKGLTIGLNLPSMGQAVDSMWSPYWGNPQSPAEYVWGNAQIAAGYDFDGIGLLRAQYVGVKNGIAVKDSAEIVTGWEMSDYDQTTSTPNSRIEAAFALSAIQGLTLDIGLKYYLPSDQKFAGQYTSYSEYAKGFVVGLGGKYAGGGFAKGAYTIEGRVDTAFLGKFKTEGATDDTEIGLNLNIHLTPSYNLGICTVGGDIGFELQADGKSGDADVKTGYNRFGVGLWAQKGLGMAKYIKAGVGAMLPYKDTDDEEHGLVVSVPIVFQYAFF